MLTLTIRALALAFLVFMVPQAMAQAQDSKPAAGQSDLLKPEQVEALVSPIALYPDPLLSEVLMASTYPLEIVEAERWVRANQNLKGDQLKAAVDKQEWDDSVKALVATPDVLQMMSDKLDWTRDLGDAVLAQQGDVMDAVQRLRTKAQSNNKLATNKQQTVSTEQQEGKQVIVIQPTEPDTVYVPYYDPAVVYGAWPYPSYPPYYFGAPGYIAGGLIATGIAFGAGYALGRWAGGAWGWGGGFNWGGNNINVNRNVNRNGNVNIGNKTWNHNPAHRQGVRYNNANVSQKFGGNRGAGAQNRGDFRGRGGQGGLQGGAGNRGNLGGGAGNRPGGGAGAGAGNRGGAGVANRGGAGVNRGGGGGAGAGARGGGRGGGGNAFGNVSSGRAANMQSSRGRSSMGGGGGGGARGGGGGGGMRGGGGGGGRGGGGGGGRRSDADLKHDIVFLSRLNNGIGLYRFVYNGSDNTAYVGVIAQEVQAVRPDAVRRGSDGYLRVYYDKLGVKFQTYDAWRASGAQAPVEPWVMH